MTRVLAVAFHAERLHDDAVWRRVESLASMLVRRGWRATFFVYPFRAEVAGRDIAVRVQTLMQMGHEIGQHTHFYRGRSTEKPDKVTDLSAGNVVACLGRDRDTLVAMGAPPRGFTAGAWFVTDTVLAWLAGHDFDYDCSARHPNFVAAASTPDREWRATPESFGPLLRLPTTCSVGEWFKWGRRLRREMSYQLVYLHDYDLLSFRYELLTRLLLRASGGVSACGDVAAGMVASAASTRGARAIEAIL